MGNGLSSVFSCFRPANRTSGEPDEHQQEVIFTPYEPLDETLGLSFCYVRSSARFLSPTQSNRFPSPSHSFRFSPPHEPGAPKNRTGPPETGFKTISGASVSANSSTPRSVLLLENIYDDVTESMPGGGGGGIRGSIVNGFESTSSFSALPLQPVPRGGAAEPLGPMERGGFFLSGPIERGALSGPLDANTGSDRGGGRVPFSAPLGGPYVKKKRKKGILGIHKAFYGNFSEKRPWVVPVLNFVSRRDESTVDDKSQEKMESNIQWALGKAGEDRVHVVVSEEQGWLFVGIYDGFNGPEAPEFLMGNLYRAVYNELQGLFWEVEESEEGSNTNYNNPSNVAKEIAVFENNAEPPAPPYRGSTKRVTFQSDGGSENRVRRRQLWEFLAEDDPEYGLDLSGSDRFAFSVDDAISVKNAGSAVSRRWLLLSKLKHGLSKHRGEGGHGRKLFPWKFGLEEKEKVEAESRVEERSAQAGKKRKEGPINHELVLGALSRGLEVTELAYLDMTDKVLDTSPELALMGSCLLVVLMRDEDVYVMNVGDSRAIVAHIDPQEVGPSKEGKGGNLSGQEGGKVEELLGPSEREITLGNEASTQEMRLAALQLSTDHSTSIEEVRLIL